jgi:hypothetical protein
VGRRKRNPNVNSFAIENARVYFESLVAQVVFRTLDTMASGERFGLRTPADGAWP